MDKPAQTHSPTAPTALAELGGWPGVLTGLTAGEHLSRQVARAAMAEILAGEATAAQIAGFVIALRAKGETTDEMVGMTSAMLDASMPLTVPLHTVDIVGTGGSGHRRKHALNVSTMASFVASAAGATVCKHGNYRASSTSGAFDFLTALGLKVDLDGPALEACVAETGLGFALARLFHPAMRHAGPVRAELGVPTVFNLLGPIAHPGRVRRQLIGTANEALAKQLADVCYERGVDRVWVVTGAGGLDELSTTGPSVIFDVGPEGVERRELDLRFLGIVPPDSLDALSGGSAEENVAIFDAILTGREASPRRDIVVLNAGAALVIAGVVTDLAAGIREASAAIDDGRALAKLEALREATHRL